MNTLSAEVLNAREVDVSGDLMRLQRLASREIQNLLGDGSANSGGQPISSLSGTLSLVGVASTFTMTLAACGAFFSDPSDPGLTADDSAYKIVRWVLQTLAFANPDGANPRIDLVIATPNMVAADPATRNILTDPVTRTFAPQVVNKTVNPQATITVLAGTPASSPVPPALPARSMAVCEVYVPAASADSTAFFVSPRVFRRAPFPWSTLSGRITGFVPQWDLTVTPGVTDSAITFPVFDDCKIMIDGEMLETIGFALAGAIYQDAGSNNPFAAAASANWHKPYYLYAVGGRNAPQLGGAAHNTSVVIVESLVPPLTETGHPTAAITTPRGTTTQLGAVYIGLGFIAAGTTKRLPCIQGVEFTELLGTSVLGVINLLLHTHTTANYEAYDTHAPAVVPAVSTKTKLQVIPGSTVTNGLFIAPDNGAGTGPMPGYGVGFTNPILPAQTLTGPNQISSAGIVPINSVSPKIWGLNNPGAGTTGVILTAFDHRVRRI